MIEKLNAIDLILSIDNVLIENQPTLKNPTMKTISTFLFSYFIMKKYEGKTKETMEIKFCSPSNKIKMGGIKATDKVSKTNESNVYKITKGLGVKICKLLVEHNEDYVKMLEKHKKQDDMADAFLQSLIFNFELPEKYSEKIKNMDVNEINGKKINQIDKKSQIDLDEIKL
tara:strand:- start:19 stop:531 length:513 start_codon:yes stop_codon:yes gene_type:complete